MGGIDLDPASCTEANKTVNASQYYDATMDGLMQSWWGRVFLNAPYGHGRLQARFVTKLLAEIASGNVVEAVTITSNASECSWWQALAARADALCFPSSRVKFYGPALGRWDRPTRGQTIHYFGAHADRFAFEFSSIGTVWT